MPSSVPAAVSETAELIAAWHKKQWGEQPFPSARAQVVPLPHQQHPVTAQVLPSQLPPALQAAAPPAHAAAQCCWVSNTCASTRLWEGEGMGSGLPQQQQRGTEIAFASGSCQSHHPQVCTSWAAPRDPQSNKPSLNGTNFKILVYI